MPVTLHQGWHVALNEHLCPMRRHKHLNILARGSRITLAPYEKVQTFDISLARGSNVLPDSYVYQLSQGCVLPNHGHFL